MNMLMNNEPVVIEPPATDVDFQKFMGTVTNAKLEDEAGKPPMYAVVLVNDPSTAADFVTRVIVEAFKVPASQAAEFMLAAHRGGSMVVCVLAKEVAETRLEAANAMIRVARPGRDFADWISPTCQLTFSLEPETKDE